MFAAHCEWEGTSLVVVEWLRAVCNRGEYHFLDEKGIANIEPAFEQFGTIIGS